jgi:Baseplate J-like protein
MSETATLNTCGCCEGIAVETPVAIDNRPGLPAIAYRVGNYASFRQSLLALLSDARFSVLRQLRTRDNDDFTIALLDAWAVTSDVLAFYQERIANEFYLRTATERLSILEQSRLLGYQLAPGLAATTYLAFTMEEVPGAPQQSAQPLQLSIGTRAQSVPGQDEQPQTFETIEAIETRVEWNAILPQLTESQTLAWDMTELWLEGANLLLTVGDLLLLHAPNQTGGFDASLRRVTKVTPDAAGNRTSVLLDQVSDAPQAVGTNSPAVFVMRSLVSPFGHNAPEEAIYVNGKIDRFQEWPMDDEAEERITLSSRNEKILKDSWVVIEQDEPAVLNLTTIDADPERIWKFSSVNQVTHRSVAKYGMAGNATRLVLDKPWEKGVESTLAFLRSMTIAAQSEEVNIGKFPLTYPVYDTSIALDNRVEGLLSGRPAAITGKRQRIRIASLPLLPAATKSAILPGLPEFVLDEGGSVQLQLGDVFIMAAPPLKFDVFRIVPLTPSELGAALREDPSSRLRLQLIDRDGRAGRLDIQASFIALDPAAADDETISEIAFIDDEPSTAITHDRDRTTLQLASPLANVYDRATVRLNANVAATTHGESVRELLGSGDATLAYQSFVLRQPPLTYVSAETPSGRASTLKIYVNDVLWQEAPFFYGRGPTERIYILRQDDDGRTTVRFGDGVNGARLPTGQNNVRAEYRKGSGVAGLVQAGQLSQLVSRPLGLKEAVNPEAAEGAEDVETRDAARENAPLTVLTLDRAVSLQDYEDFARTFAGIAKAQAVWVWDGRKRTVFITVAGPDGAAIDENGAVAAQLKAALREYGDPYVPFTVKSYRQAQFQIHGTITIDADHVIETVMAAVTADLSTRYAFDARAFGQPVALSQTIAIMQAIPGVVAVDIDKFYRNDQPTPDWRARLDADRPAMGADGAVVAAELLLLDAESLGQIKPAVSPVGY